MQYKISDKIVDYDGAQLKSHWISENFGLHHDAIVAFTGGCDVKHEHMVDLEDLEAGASIFSKEMLHFIVEHFGMDLRETILCQRLLICLIKDALKEQAGDLTLTRTGDDLFDGKSKLTVSIATVSPLSGLIHAGINIISEGTPVRTKGLKDYGIDPRILAGSVLEKYTSEIDLIHKGMSKVRWVS